MFFATLSFKHVALLKSSGMKQEWQKIGTSWDISMKVKVLVIHNFLGVQGQHCSVLAAGEDLLPPVQRGQLLLEED